MADPFPLYVPPEARRLFQSESLLRRFAQAAHWDDASSLLELHGSLGALAVTKALACHLTIIEPDERLADALKERSRIGGIADKVAIKHGATDSVTFAERAFDGIFSFGRVIGHVGDVAKKWRPNLAYNGRLGVTVVLRVSRRPDEALLAAWETRLGAPLLTPREAMMRLEQEGFEPELIESLGEPELDEHYRELESMLGKTADTDEQGKAALKAELELYKAGKSGVSLGFIVARRKEPGEKPPPSRDGG